MRLDLVEVEPHLYKKTELFMNGTATYENGNHERFSAYAFVGMYGAINIRLTVRHACLTETTVGVKLNKRAFEKNGIEYNDMDAVIPMLIDHASKKNNYGVLINKCTGVEFDA